MYRIKNELDDLETAIIKECENCGENKRGRNVEVGSNFVGANRGSYWLCFDCVGPRIFWQKSPVHPTIFETPVKHEDYIAALEDIKAVQCPQS